MTHIVERGDTLSGIAARYGVTVAAIAAANPHIKNVHLIYEGQAVMIPGMDQDKPRATFEDIGVQVVALLDKIEALPEFGELMVMLHGD